MRIGVIGAGFIGSVHGRNIAAHHNARLSCVYDIDQERARRLAGICDARVSESAEALLGAEDVDAVLIASSTPTHADYLKTAVHKGKAVLCEKPISLDLATAREVGEELSGSKVPVMTGFNRRFDADYAGLKRAVDVGDIGAVEIAQITHRGPRLPSLEYLKHSGGQMRDSGVHFFDLLRWICADDPVEVFVFGACLVDPGIAEFGDTDTAVISLRLSRGALGQINFSRRTAYGYDDRIEVFGSEGMVESQRKRSGDIALYKGEKIITDGLNPGWFERISDTYRLELDAFIGAVERGVSPQPGLEDGLKAQAIAEAAAESLITSRPVAVTY